jgi:hypothetical protein
VTIVRGDDSSVAPSPPLRAVPEPVARIIGRVGPRRRAHYRVDRTAIGYFCEFSENADPRCDPGRMEPVLAPATFVLTAMRSPAWAPNGLSGEHQYVHVGLPLGTDKVVNVSVQHEFHRRLVEGDHVTFTNTITEVTPKINRLGSGFLVTEQVDSWTQHEQPIATTVVTSFMYGDASVTADRGGPNS